MNQKLSDWANLAEIVGSFAIVVTLVILIVEVRANTAATEAATRQSDRSANRNDRFWPKADIRTESKSGFLSGRFGGKSGHSARSRLARIQSRPGCVRSGRCRQASVH